MIIKTIGCVGWGREKGGIGVRCCSNKYLKMCKCLGILEKFEEQMEE